MFSRIVQFFVYLCGATVLYAASTLAAQTYPSRPVRVVVPFAAGGTFDLVGRVVSRELTELWSQQVIVDNRPGGGTIIATKLVVNSTPDGHTIYLSPNALAANPALHEKLPYDTKRDLQPIVLIAAQPMALGAHPSFTANSVRQLIALAKEKPGAFSYGTAGIGSGGHLAGEIFKSMADIEVAHISYKGGNVAMADVMANQIPLVMTGLPNLLPQQKAGKVKILAITDGQRSPAAKDIPTIGETVPGYEFRNWFGFVAPAGTPRTVVRRINDDVNKVLASNDVRKRLLDLGFIVLGGTTEEFATVIATDTDKFAKIIREAGIHLK